MKARGLACLASLGVLLAAASGLAGDKPTPRAAAQDILRHKDFPFCRASKGSVPVYEADWCTVAHRASTCPEIQEMCARGGDLGAMAPGTGREGGGAGKARRTVESGDAGGAASVHAAPPDWLRWLNHALLGIGLALIVVVLARWLLARKGGRAPEEKPEPTLT